jgi:phosphopantothenoylcysteine synthetase/decarboxylase
MTALLARGAIISEQFDMLTKEQHQTNVLLTDLYRKNCDMVVANKEFIEVIRHFFANDLAIKIADSKKKEEREKKFEETPADLRY